MNTETSHATQAPVRPRPSPSDPRASPLRQEARPVDHRRRLDVAASRGSVVLDLLLPRIEPGEIDIHLDIDHAMVKLLVPDDANIDHDDLRRIGRGRVKDWTGAGTPDGRRIKLRGELRDAEIRVHRGGIAILSLLLSRTSRNAVRQARRDGHL